MGDKGQVSLSEEEITNERGGGGGLPEWTCPRLDPAGSELIPGVSACRDCGCGQTDTDVTGGVYPRGCGGARGPEHTRYRDSGF